MGSITALHCTAPHRTAVSASTSHRGADETIVVHARVGEVAIRVQPWRIAAWIRR